MKKRYNQRKKEVLETISGYGEVSARQLARMINISVNNAQSLCYHYRKAGLLRISRKTSNNEFYYELTRRGRNRLNFLEDKLERERKPYWRMKEKMEEKMEELLK